MRPLVAITAGDPAGIGPEIVLKALSDPRIYGVCRPVVVAGAQAMAATASSMRLTPVRRLDRLDAARFEPGTVDVLDVPVAGLQEVSMGKAQPVAGRAALAWVKKAVELALQGYADAVCTAPLNKEAVVSSGEAGFRGHTEYLGELSGVPDPLTMFVVDDLRILFLTRHVSLAEAVSLVKADRLKRFIPAAVTALSGLGFREPRIAVAGLNPHSGESGMFGHEEQTEIRPAVAWAKDQGLNVVGPVPADSVFHQAKMGKYDAVISLYHDQGHIAAKTLDFERTVSVTLALPFVRTSVDHGTAFDIAGKGMASDVSMKEAIKVAADYSVRLAR